MSTIWFKKLGWFYIPTTIAGAVITLLAFIFCATVFVAIDRHAHSVSDVLYGVFPYFVSTVSILFWIAGNTSQKKD